MFSLKTFSLKTFSLKFRLGVAALSVALAAAPSARAADGFAVEAMPFGITLEYLGQPQGYGMQRISLTPRREITYSNEKGLTLYTYDMDAAGKSNCTGECVKKWIPLKPVAGAKAIPQWTIFTREDGTKQWAHNGKPLYTYIDDKEGGDVLGLGDDPALDVKGGNAGKGVNVKLPDGWHIEKFQTGSVPTYDFTAPPGFGVREVTDANAVVIVDSETRVLYTYDGDINKDARPCSAAVSPCAGFNPVEAPTMARPVGDWSLIDRADGIRQWRYKNKPLYTYEADRIIGDVHGEGVDKRWHLATFAAYYLPPGVSFREDEGRGRILATDKGMTLYRRMLKTFNNASSQFAHEIPYQPRIGRIIRDVACNERCRESWKPLRAPANAQPCGYWGVHVLPDGSKQWTYKDYALYTFVGDKKPGDMTGDSVYDERLSDDPTVDNDRGFPALYKAGFAWTFASL